MKVLTRSIFICGPVGRKVCRIEVPAGLPLKPEKEQKAVVKELIEEYIGSDDHDLCVRTFSGPESYTYKPNYDTGWRFSLDGSFIRKLT